MKKNIRQFQTEQRKILRNTRKKIKDPLREELSHALLNQIISSDMIYKTQHIASFLSMPEEISTVPVNHYLSKKCNHPFYVPVVTEKNQILQFAPCTKNQILVTDKEGMLVPDVEEKEHLLANQLDICFVPLVGFDLNGNRIGMGGGYYDKTFTFLNTNQRNESTVKLFGIAYDCQQIKDIARNNWDVKLDAVFTPSQTYKFYD